MPNTHEWKCKFAVRVKRKGRAKGGFILGKKKGWSDKESKIMNMTEEGFIYSEIGGKDTDLSIISVYNGERWSVIEEKLNKLIECREHRQIIIGGGGDFNIRTGELGGIETAEGGMERKSTDKMIGRDGKRLINWIQEKGWYILNGAKDGEWEGEYTYVGARGSSIIDYVFVNENVYDKIRKFKVEDRIDSDHMPIVVSLRQKDDGGQEQEEEQKIERRNEEKKIVICWDEEAKQKYKEETEMMMDEDIWKTYFVGQKWNKLKEWIKGAMIRKEIKKRRRKIGYKEWWDKECSREKRKLKRLMQKWKKGEIGRQRLIEGKRDGRKYKKRSGWK